MNHTEATQYIKATLAAFGPGEAINMTQDTWTKLNEAMGVLIKQPAQQEPPVKLKVTLEDRPIDIELAQYKRMFEAARSALGSIGDALGIDPEEGGAEPILAAISELKAVQPAQQKPVAWCPDVCPITGLPFFMWIEHHETGQRVPTYGGPYDSYTIPVRDRDGSYCRERYDHDRGGWLTDEVEDVGVQIVSDQAFVYDDERPQASEPERPAPVQQETVNGRTVKVDWKAQALELRELVRLGGIKIAELEEALAEQPAQQEQCTWAQPDSEHVPDTWEASCGAMWTFTEGGPKDNDMHFCPQCGKKAIEAAHNIKGQP